MEDVDSSSVGYQTSAVISIKEIWQSSSSDTPLPSPEVNSFRDDLSKQAEHILLEEFPSKIAHFKSTLDGHLFSLNTMAGLRSGLDLPAVLCNGDDQPVTKKRKIDGSESATDDSEATLVVNPSAPIPCNKRLVEVTNFLKPEIVECIDKCNLRRCARLQTTTTT
eukprot:Em0004g674a